MKQMRDPVKMYKFCDNILSIRISKNIFLLSSLCLLFATLACSKSTLNETGENDLTFMTYRNKEYAELETKEKSQSVINNYSRKAINQVINMGGIDDTSDKVLNTITEQIDRVHTKLEDTLDYNNGIEKKRSMAIDAWSIVSECRAITGCEEMFKQEGCLLCECRDEAIIAQCSEANLTEIPQDLPQNITHFILENNQLNDSALYPRVFARYAQLQVLHLGSNIISSLPEGAFEGLENLAHLNLFNNTIAMNSNLNSSRVFASLNKTLLTLVLHGNNHNTSEEDLFYPGFALSFLNNLSHLYLDGLRRKQFDPFFAQLQKLTNLSLSGFYPGYCGMESLNATMFNNVKSLKFLNISNCAINKTLVEKEAFRPLTQLETLDLSNNFHLGLETVGELMYGLRKSKTLRYLKVQKVVPSFSPCIVVYKKTLRYFKETRLERIDAMDNEIEMIAYGALSMLPDTLKFINLTNNKIMFGSYWQNMVSLVSLENLHLDGFSHPVAFPETFPKHEFHCPRAHYQVDDDIGRHDRCVCNDDSCSNNETKFILPLPPNLKMLTMHSKSIAYNVQNMSFCPNNSLEYADLSGNHFPTLSGPVTGLSRLRVLNLYSCFLETIGEHFFDNLTSLEHLNLYQNLLGDSLADDPEGRTFRKLENLKVLNLSLNNLYRLSVHFLRDMTRLEAIDLSVNRLSHVNFNISHLNNLRHINLTDNDLSTLPSHFTDHVSSLISQGINVTVDMQKNPITCDCLNLKFLNWVVQSKTFGNNFSLYYCKAQMPDKEPEEKPHGFAHVVRYLRRKCNKPIVLYISVSSITLIVMLAFIGLVLYRFRWTLRYWYHAAKLKVSANQKMEASQFKYDVFVSYATKDTDFVLKIVEVNMSTISASMAEENVLQHFQLGRLGRSELRPKLQERNIKILIHGEKFKVGRYITDNIYKAIVKSRKTLVVITSQMLASSWCNYELQMARLEAVNTGRSVLVCLFLEDIPTSMMGPEVLSHVKSSTYITYPKLPQHKGAFWDKLADDLRSP